MKKYRHFVLNAPSCSVESRGETNNRTDRGTELVADSMMSGQSGSCTVPSGCGARRSSLHACYGPSLSLLFSTASRGRGGGGRPRSPPDAAYATTNTPVPSAREDDLDAATTTKQVPPSSQHRPALRPKDPLPRSPRHKASTLGGSAQAAIGSSSTRAGSSLPQASAVPGQRAWTTKPLIGSTPAGEEQRWRWRKHGRRTRT
uniref:Uncharacterized protein n=1 Tax=Setaria viridis TaxID=4556 RepID=A0A4V6D1I0_SETVI|nr:hypothetical protein SEVIR_9G316500v2 [Setaria viridis]